MEPWNEFWQTTTSIVVEYFDSVEIVKRFCFMNTGQLDEWKGVPNLISTYLSQCDCSSSRLFLWVFTTYLIVAIVTNLIGLYKIIVAWNLIISQQRIDLPEFCKRRRRMTYKETLKLQLVPPRVLQAQRCCSICLSDFDKNEVVTSCEDGCRNWFHKECLFEWLDRSDSCPCCRRDLLARKTRGFFADLSACMGFRAR